MSVYELKFAFELYFHRQESYFVNGKNSAFLLYSQMIRQFHSSRQVFLAFYK